MEGLLRERREVPTHLGVELLMFIAWEDNFGRATEGETGSTHLGVELLMFITWEDNFGRATEGETGSTHL